MSDQSNFDGESDEKLIADAKAVHQAIYEFDCAGAHDVRTLDAIIEELTNRGYQQIQSIDFVKE